MVFRQLVIDSVNRAVSTVDGAAGKSVNVAKVLKVLAEKPFAVGFLGGDRGEELRRVLAEKQVASDFVTVQSRTRQCITVLDESNGWQTELVEESSGVTAEEYARLRKLVAQQIVGCRAVVMSGTLAPGVPVDFYAECTRLAHMAGAIALVDAQGAALTEALKERPDLVKPNRAELAATVDCTLPDEAAVIRAIGVLHERGAQQVVVTAGAGPVLASDGKTVWRITSPRVNALNPIGSGDAFTAGVVVGLLRGDGLGRSCCLGAAAGAANALTVMPGEVNASDVARLLKEVTAEMIT